MPDRAPTGRPAAWRLDPAKCASDLDAFADLLAAKPALAERADILPFFRDHPHLAAFLGTYAYTATSIDRLAVEVSLFGQFVVDVIAGNHAKRAYCLVEFEDGFADSIFVKKGRHTSTWAPRFEQGISQIVDWMWLLDDLEHSLVFEELFGPRPIELTLLLVIGRDSGVSAADRRRLEWRSRYMPVNSQRIYIYTFDDLLRDLRGRLEDFQAYAARPLQ
jgi:hypothetical protein